MSKPRQSKADTMLERAARAMATYEGEDYMENHQHYDPLAREAVLALIGPSEELDRVVGRAAWHSGSGQKPQNIRGAMVQAILSGEA